MPDDSGDLRDRFRRTDYGSAPLRPRPISPSVSIPAPQPLAPVPTQSAAVPLPQPGPVQPRMPRSLDEAIGNFTQAELTAPDRLEEIAAPRATVKEPAFKPMPIAQPKPIATPRPIPIDFRLQQKPQHMPMQSQRPIVDQPPRRDFKQDEAEEFVMQQAAQPAAPTRFVPTQPISKSRHARKEAKKQTKLSQPNSGKKSKKWLVLVPLILFVLSGAGLGAWYLIANKNPIPAKFTSQKVGFTVYYPKKLPAGFRVAPGSFTLTNNTLVFNINSDDGKIIPVSEQVVPSGQTANDLVPAPTSIKVTDSQDIDINGGKSAISTWKDKTLTSTVIGNTWIILNATNTTPENAIILTRAFEKS